MFCTNCGKKAGEGENFCCHCGTAIKKAESPFEGIAPNAPIKPITAAPMHQPYYYYVPSRVSVATKPVSDVVNALLLVLCLVIPLVGLIYSHSYSSLRPKSSFIYGLCGKINAALIVLFIVAMIGVSVTNSIFLYLPL